MGQLIEDPFRAARLILTLRREGITDHSVLEAIEATPRRGFVDDALADLADEDCVLPLPCGQTLPRPTVTARMVQALEVIPASTMSVLIIGGGSGYMAAVIGRMAGRVHVMERFRQLTDAMSARFEAFGLGDIRVRQGDGTHGWREAAPFDRIIFACGVDEIADEVFAQLASGGKCVAPVWKDGRSVLCRFTSDGGLERAFGAVALTRLHEGVPSVL